jgi:hypothetical protein
MLFRALDEPFGVECCNERMRHVVHGNFSALLTEERAAQPRQSYRIPATRDGQLRLECNGELLDAESSESELLYALEKDLTVWLQRRRPDLLFLHAAALERNGKAYVLAADSGSGKSTTAWGLLHYGFRYLSDELAPVDLNGMQVHGYPHALCLKDAPSDPRFLLPDATIDLGRTLHVPVHSMPAPVAGSPQPLGAVFLIRYHPELREPFAERLRPAEAAARLYPNVLNALAHPEKALPAVLEIARAVPCFMLQTAQLHPTCLLASSLVANMDTR